MANPSEVRRYCAEIEYVAGFKLKGISPLDLTSTDIGESQKLATAINHLNQHRLIPEVDRLVERIKKAQRTPPKIKPSPPPQPDTKPPIPWQSNFWDELGLGVDQASLEETRVLLEDPERGIGRLHNKDVRRRLQQKETNHELKAWRRFLREIGAIRTWAQRRDMLTNVMNMQITLLKELGIWEEIVQYGLTQDTIEKLRTAMDQPRTFHTDPHSSEGVTLYSSPIAMALKQILDKHEI